MLMAALSAIAFIKCYGCSHRIEFLEKNPTSSSIICEFECNSLIPFFIAIIVCASFFLIIWCAKHFSGLFTYSI